MKIVQINTVFDTGSVGRISAELHRIAELSGHQSYYVYGRGDHTNTDKGYKTGSITDFCIHVMSNFIRGNSGFSSRSATIRLLSWLDSIQPDLLHLHNIHGFYLHVGILFEYIKTHHIPVIWTLHDCWAFTGQCAYFDFEGCQKWKTGCHDCALYRRDYPYSIFKDNSVENYRLKKSAFTGVEKLHIVTPSRWLASLVQESFLQVYPVSVIQNGIDIEIFHPDSNSPVIEKNILGVANIWTPRKGLSFFLQLADTLDEAWHITLVGLNEHQKKFIQKKYGSRITTKTRTENLQELVELYNHSTIFVNPTLEDNFPTTNLEALACGTPVITFNTGGSPESLNENCGIVVDKGDLKQLYNAINSFGENKKISRLACRQRSKDFDKKLKFKEYITLYDQMVK